MEMVKKKIFVIWDSMLDIYTYGHTDRENPECTAPLLTVDREDFILGWASNVAHNLATLDGTPQSVWLISVVGEDSNGKVFSHLCEDAGISFYPLFTWVPTITKTRFVNKQRNSQLLRVDCEVKMPLTDSHMQNILHILELEQPEFIVISDYNKWIINYNLVSLLQKFASARSIKVLVDTKPQNLSYFDWVYLIKPNLKEFYEMVGQKWMDKQEDSNNDYNIEQYGKKFVTEHRTNLVVTRWSKWSSLITLAGEVYHFLPEEEISVFDVTGAWDTFIATLVYALTKQYPLYDAVKLANLASWQVVRKFGTVTITTKELNI